MSKWCRCGLEKRYGLCPVAWIIIGAQVAAIVYVSVVIL